MLEKLLKEYSFANNNLKTYFSNKSIPLDNRWSYFTTVPLELRQISNDIIFNVPSDLLIDMSINKGDVLSYEIFLENIGILKDNMNSSDIDLSGESRRWFKNVNLDNLYEIVLSNNFHFFTNNF